MADDDDDLIGARACARDGSLDRSARAATSLHNVSRISRNSLNLPGSPAPHTSHASSFHPPPPPTLLANSSSSSPTGNIETGFDTALDLKQEADLNVAPFAFKQRQLASLVDSKSLENLKSLGGVQGLLRGLGTNPLHGLSTKRTPPSQLGSPHPGSNMEMSLLNLATSPAGLHESTASLGAGPGVGRPALSAYEATVEDRQRIYGHNIPPQPPSKSLLRIMWFALQNKVIALLSIAAPVLLALGLIQHFGTTRPAGDPPVDWVEGVATITAILIVVSVGSLSDWQKERQFRALNQKKEDRVVKIIRDGGEQQINERHVVVGDVVVLEPGDVIPCDGVFLSGKGVRCVKSSATGESGAITKLSYEDCIALRDERQFDHTSPSGNNESNTNGSGFGSLGHADCFIVSGSEVREGFGYYVVTSVGTKNFNGRGMMALRNESEMTPLQIKLNELALEVAKIGSMTGALFFVSLLIRYLVQPGTQSPPSEKGVTLVNILIIAVTLVVVAAPEGLLLATTLALARATRRMSEENLLVRVLGSCETMANASVICTDKTGIITQNKMTVIAGSFGVHARFVRRLEENGERLGNEAHNAMDSDVDLAKLNTVLPQAVRDLFNAAIAINSTASEDVDSESGAPVFIGNKTKTALLGLAKELGWPNCKDTHDSANIVQMIPFSNGRKCMGCVVRLLDGNHRLYIQGASEILTRKCVRHVAVHRDAANDAQSGNQVETVPIGEIEEKIISRTITSYESQALHTITLCYRDFPDWHPKGARLDEVDFDDLTTDLTLICITAIEDPLRIGVREAVANCGKAGVRVIMCTGDNIPTARSIAQQCDIYTPEGTLMEGPDFRTLSPDAMKAIVPRLQVLARSSPEDKRILVETLKELGDVVGVTGDCANDGPALKTAHVGFSMGIAGTEVAKEASDIILMDDNFSSIVNAIMWGRSVRDSVRKFLQFQISAVVTAIVTMFFWALASSEESVLGAVQLHWINLIIGVFAALALATDPATPALLDRKPDKKMDPLFTVNMIKQILGQAVYQIIVILIFHFLGSRILGFDHFDDYTLQKHRAGIVQTLVFNAFVFAQIFNSFNCRRLDRKLNVFEGVSKNWHFMAITSIEVAVQVTICSFSGPAFEMTRMGGREWGISVALGFVSLPVGALIRLVPNEPCERMFEKLQLLPRSEVLPTTRPDTEPGRSFGVEQVGDESGTFSPLYDTSLPSSSFECKSHSGLPEADGQDVVSGTVPALVAPPSHDVVAPDRQSHAGEPLGF